MIVIKIVNPHKTPHTELRKTAAYLLALCGDELVQAPAAVNVSAPQIKVTADRIKTSDNTAGTPVYPTDNKVAEKLNSLDTVLEELASNTSGEWDPKIHSRTKSKNPDGSYKLKRGIEPSEICVPKPPVPLPPHIETVAPKESEATELQEETAASQEMGFPELIEKISAPIKNGKLKLSQILEIIRPLGITAIPGIATRPELLPYINLEIDKLIGGA